MLNRYFLFARNYFVSDWSGARARSALGSGARDSLGGGIALEPNDQPAIIY